MGRVRQSQPLSMRGHVGTRVIGSVPLVSSFTSERERVGRAVDVCGIGGGGGD